MRDSQRSIVINNSPETKDANGGDNFINLIEALCRKQIFFPLEKLVRKFPKPRIIHPVLMNVFLPGTIDRNTGGGNNLSEIRQALNILNVRVRIFFSFFFVL
jgi:hypothetical protein